MSKGVSAARYKRFRASVGTQRYVAELLDITPETLSRRERGHLKISYEAWLAMRYLVEGDLWASGRIKNVT